MHSIESTNLTKIFKPMWGGMTVRALDDFSLSVPKGTIFGLLGPNGAGKTTFVKILLGITHSTSGDAKILGENVQNYKIRKKVGYLPENHKYPPYLTGGQVLEFFAQLAGYTNENLDRRIDGLLDTVKMLKWKKTKVKNYSKGMMQRLGLAQALLNEPELIFLDEPTDGVDPIGRKEIRDILIEQKNLGRTIFLNSHLLSEVELITDTVAILNKGKLLKTGTVEELTVNQQICEITTENSFGDDFKSLFTEKFNVDKAEAQMIRFNVKDFSELNSAIDLFREKSINIKSVVPHKNTLEDYFISVINENENGN